jgi:hypothetical protein
MYFTDRNIAAKFEAEQPELRGLTSVPSANRKRQLSLLEGLRRARKGAEVVFWPGRYVPEDWDSGDWRAAKTKGVVKNGRFLLGYGYVKVGTNRWRRWC